MINIICIILSFCFMIFLIALYKKDIIEFKFRFTLPFRLSIEWKKRKK